MARRLQYLTVVTYGRTGSTAIQSSLNSLPGVLIRGENYNALRGLHQYLQSIAETADRHHAGKPAHPWFGSARLSPQDVRSDLERHVVDHVLRPQRDTRWAGFKEVRYEPGHFADYDLLLDYLLFLDKVMPGIRYLLNTREADEAALSGWWPGNEQAPAVIATTNAWLRAAAADLNAMLGPDRAVVVDYENWAGDPQVLIDAYGRLGLPRDDAAVRAALGTRLEHGPHAAGDGGDSAGE